MIPPGQVGKVEATMDTGELRGAVRRSITLRTNDPAKPVAYLNVTAEVIGSVVMLPQPQFAVGSARGGGAKRRVLVRKDLREKGELRISDVEGSKPWIDARARRVEQREPGKDKFPTAVPGDWIVEVDLVGDPPAGVHRESVRFATALELEPVVEVPVMVSVIPPVVFRPAEVELSPSPEGGSLAGEVFAVVGGAHTGKPLEVEGSPETLEVSLAKIGGRHYRIEVALAGEDRAGFDTGAVVVTIGDHREEIPVRIEGVAPTAP